MKVFMIFFFRNKIKEKKIEIEIETTEDYNDWISKYILVIKNVNDDKYGMLTHKNSKFLFYNFNNYFNRIGRPNKFIRHTVISNEN